MKSIVLFLLVVIIACGCSSEQYEWQTETGPYWHEIQNTYFSAVISLVQADTGYEGFRLLVKNNSAQDITVDWKETMFLKNGRVRGGFMIEDIADRDRNTAKLPEVIPPGSILTETLYPVNLASFSGQRHHELFPDGINGIRLVIRVGKDELRTTKDFLMTSVEVKKLPQPNN